MKKKILVVILSLLFPVLMKAQQEKTVPLTLRRAVQMAVNNQPLLREAEDYVKTAEGRVRQAESTKLPQVSASLTYAYMGPVPFFSFETPLGMESIDVAPAHNYNGHVEVKYLIFDFHRRDEMIRLLQSNKLARQEKVNLLKNRLAYATVRAFYSVLFLRQSLAVKEQQRQDLLRHLAVARKLVATGSAVSLDTLTTKVRVTAIENQKISIENLLHQNEIALKSLLNLKHSDSVAVTGKFFTSVPRMSLDSLFQTAYRNREDIKLTQIGQQTAGIQKELARRTAVPTLSAMGSFGAKNGYPDALYRLRGNWVLGLAADIPIFEGNLKKAKIETADWQIEAVKNHLEAVKKTVRREVQQAASDLSSNIRHLNMAHQEIIAAEAAVKQARVNYRSGYATNLTLLDAETSLTRARLLYVAGQYKVTLSRYRLLETLGIRIW
jgi:outer membrane protein